MKRNQLLFIMLVIISCGQNNSSSENLASTGINSQGGSASTGGTVSYTPCSCDPYVNQGDAGIATGGKGGINNDPFFTVFQAWSTSNHSDVVEGYLEDVVEQTDPSQDYTVPTMPTWQFAVSPIGEASRSIQIDGLLCSEVDRINGNSQYMIAYLTDGSMVEGYLPTDSHLFVQGNILSIDIFQPEGITGSTHPRVCGLRIRGPT